MATVFSNFPNDAHVQFYVVLLHNSGFCNGCITKRILLLQAFHSHENQYYADYDKKYYIFKIIYSFIIEKLCVLDAAVAKSTVL